ncbi:MAG TPA: response regulator [Candidatus Cybelea sp.]|nr:response regulator [Candidatus Cybelea sp.]
MRILIVEDDERLRALLRRGLTEDGYVVDAMEDGRDCDAYLASGSYDVLVLDLNLPGEDGLSLLRRLRAADSRVPVLILTARDGAADVVAGLDAGADDYLRKPLHSTNSKPVCAL